MAMRYQVRIMRPNIKAGLLRRREVAQGDIHFGSSETEEGAIALATIAPIYKGEQVWIIDVDRGSERPVLIKRGRYS